jgi:tetratricopeptide (TPR) repeat protein
MSFDEIADYLDRNKWNFGGRHWSTTSGMGNIIGKEVAYSVSGNVINLQVNSISAEILQELKDVLSRPVQVETKGDLGQQPHNINTEFNDAKANEARVTKDTAEQVIKDIDQISREKGVHIEQIKVEELQVSRSELQLKDVIYEGNEYYYKGDYLKAIESYDNALHFRRVL